MGKSKSRKTPKKEPKPKEIQSDSEPDLDDDIDKFHKKLVEGSDEEYEGKHKREMYAFDDDDEDEEELEKYEKQLRQLRSQGLIRSKFDDDDESDDDDDDDDEDDHAKRSKRKGWGTDRKMYYGADVDETTKINFEGENYDAALLEEQEAISLQKTLAQQMEEDDLGMDIFKLAEEPKKVSTIISKDLSTLNVDEKLELVKKESPELFPLLEDFKSKIEEIKPLDKDSSKYDTVRVGIILGYCMNINFYLSLKAQRKNVQSHPVVKRILEYRKLLERLPEKQKRKRKPIAKEKTKTVKRVKFEEQDEAAEEAEAEDVRRGITYQISKNKGLTPKRKKEERNPRVKLRNKFKKAMMKRKGQVRPVQKELTPYAGEKSGIKTNISKSVKF